MSNHVTKSTPEGEQTMAGRIASPKYSGHVGDGGLQGHSVSAAYPWIIRGIGDDWQAYNATSGQTYPRRERIAEAQRDLGAAVAARRATKELMARFGTACRLPESVVNNAMRRLS